MTKNVSVSRGITWLIGIVAGALLPLSGLVFAPPAQAATPIGTLCTITADGTHTCPAVPSPPSLINIGALGATDPAVATSLKALEEKAVDNTIADHDLSAGDRDAVRSWGRSDAQSELWALIVEAIKTPAASRTTDQKNAVKWMSGLASSQSQESALQSGAEYATWAGLDVGDYWQMASTASQAQLTAFLGSDVRSFNPLFTERGGYCRYHPPAPYASEYDGSSTATCFTPCTSPLGCAVPTPTYDQFVKWGQSAATYGTLTDAKFQSQAANIATGVTFGSAVVASAVAGVTIGATMGSVLFGSSVAAALLPNLVVAEALPEAAVAVLGEAAAAEYFGGLAASAIGAAVAVVILAIVVAVMEGIRVTDNAKLPGKIAELVVGARTATTDPATLIDTTAGASSLYGLFVGATLPVPDNSIACDNSLIPPWAYSSSKLPGFLTYVPLGQNNAISSPVDRSGCLNPPDIPAAQSTDPEWQVSQEGSPSTQSSPTITVADSTSNVDQTLRVHGNWFVSQVKVGDRAPKTVQTLRLTYTDWGGKHRTTWLRRTPKGDYRFFTISPDGTSNAIDPSTCRSKGTCTNDGEIHYVGTDGARYTASLRPYAPAVGTPTFSPLQGVEASAVSFDAGGFHKAGAQGAITYSWRFATCGTPGCEQVVTENGIPVIDENGHVVREPPYTDPVTGPTASHAWQAPGTYKVELTATDATGDSAKTGFYVGVAGSPPELQLAADCAVIADSACDTRTMDLGTQTKLSGVLRHAGTEDNETVQVTWGDGTARSFQNLGPNLIPFEGASTSAHLSLITDRIMRINAEHTYTKPGVYYGTVSAQDWGNGTDSETFKVTVRGPQSISFPALTDKHYGDDPFTVAATGGGSGNPVTYAAGPADVCTSGGTDGSRIALVGAGTCTVTASQAGDPPAYLAAPDVKRSFEVDPASLTITAKDATKVYGAPNPTFDTSISGLVNGDTAADVLGLQVNGPPRDTSVGPHPIVASGASIPNYDITYVDGTLNVTRAPLTITADNQVVTSGTVPTYGWTGSGWVNGDNDATLRTTPNAAPSCTATAGGSPVSTTTSPGIYPAAITCKGAVDANYDITYAAGGLTINPVLVLDQQGLPTTVPRVAKVDGVSVTLPARTAVTYNTQHTYGFPEVVVASSGVTYRTTEPSFSGTVKANRSATASYLTLTQLISQTAGIDAKQVTPLTTQWTAVQTDLKGGKTSTALRDLHTFAAAVRAQTGKKITTAASTTLLAYAQAVYQSQGGTGTV